MEVKSYLEEISNKLSKYFDINKDFMYKGIDYQLQANSFIRNEKYMGSKKLTLYAYENNEHCLIKHYKELTLESLNRFFEALTDYTLEKIVPHQEHMFSVVNGIILIDELTCPTIKKEIENHRFYKSFSFGLEGWVYQRVLLVDLSSGEVITNKRGREVVKFYKLNN